MARPSNTRTLSVWMNGEPVGRWTAGANGAPEFSYSAEWVAARHARPISLSMPLVPEGTSYRGPVVEHFFENLLPDNRAIRERIRQRFDAKSTQAFDLLAEVGRDCIGAIQLAPETKALPDVRQITSKPIGEAGVARILRRSLGGPSLGRNQDDEEGFRISLAGAQEKTALLRSKGKWRLPTGATPTTHILKLPIGEGPQGIDLTTSVENEWLCAQIMRGFGVETAECWIEQFEDLKVLVVERFDRRMAEDRSWIIRIPQEDFCQATGTGREQKYEADGGPGIKTSMDLLLGSTRADVDRADFFRTQILFWMLCAIDGHAKNFSLFLEPQGRFRLTPRYDVLSAYPVLGKKASQLSPHKVKMAMAVYGDKSRHYNWDSIFRRHWLSTARQCGMAAQVDALIEDIIEKTPRVIAEVEAGLPQDFPAGVAEPILKGLVASVKRLEVV